MSLLDEIVAWDDESVVTRAVIRESSPFVEEGRVPALLLLEYMAQSIAAYAGAQAQQRGEPVKLGYLISCRQMLLEIESLAIGDEVEVQARRRWGEALLGNFECVALRGEERIAQAQLSVYQGQLEETDRA